MQCICSAYRKKNWVISLVALFVLFCQSAGAQQKKSENAVKQILAQQTECWNRGDIKGFMQTYWQNDSLCFVGAKDITYGWEKALQRYKKSYPDTAAMGKLSFQLQQIKTIAADHCFVIGHWQLSRTAGDLEGEFTLLLKKINGQWKIIVDHSS